MARDPVLEELVQECLVWLELRHFPSMRAGDEPRNWIVSAVPARLPLLVECRLTNEPDTPLSWKRRMSFSQRGFICGAVSNREQLAELVARVSPATP